MDSGTLQVVQLSRILAFESRLNMLLASTAQEYIRTALPNLASIKTIDPRYESEAEVDLAARAVLSAIVFENETPQLLLEIALDEGQIPEVLPFNLSPSHVEYVCWVNPPLPVDLPGNSYSLTALPDSADAFAQRVTELAVTLDQSQPQHSTSQRQQVWYIWSSGLPEVLALYQAIKNGLPPDNSVESDDQPLRTLVQRMRRDGRIERQSRMDFGQEPID